jgi:hypothetical protein
MLGTGRANFPKNWRKPGINVRLGIVAGMARRRRSRRFTRPVVIQPGRIDRDRVVNDVRDAAQVLLREWPDQTSKKRQAAMEACLRVFRGEGSARSARRAFIEAAKDARIFLGEKV